MQDLEPMFPAAAPSEIPTDLLPESAAPAAEPEAEAPERTPETDLSDAGPEAPDCPPEPEAPDTVIVADIHFRNNSKVYFFDPADLTLKAGDHVIIDTARGHEYGICAAGNHPVPRKDIVPPLRRVLRLATEKDERINAENEQKEKRAFEVCQQKIQAHGLDMQLVSAECAFDGSKILFFFTADGRVDFRELVKNLASVFRTRIELRQIGVRDKAKMVGGLGMCGRPFCCREFLDDFQPVSIKMAKTQNLSLNPTKISGACGRLMCCLKYEQDAYEDLLKTSPKNESFVDTVDGRGTVVDVNLLRQCVRVRMEDEPDTINTYRNSEIVVLRSGKAKKTDPPVPRDLAPLSSLPKPEQKREPMPESLPDVMYRGEALAASSPAEKAEKAEKPDEAGRPSRRRRRRPSGEKSEAGQPPKQDKAAEKPQQPKAEKPRQERPEKPRQDHQSEKPQREKRPEGENAPSESHRPRRRRRPRGKSGESNPPRE